MAMATVVLLVMVLLAMQYCDGVGDGASGDGATGDGDGDGASGDGATGC